MQALILLCLSGSLGLELQGTCIKGVPGDSLASAAGGVCTKEGRQASEFPFFSLCAFVPRCNQFLNGTV